MAHTELFCKIDDFCKTFKSNTNKYLISQAKPLRNRVPVEEMCQHLFGRLIGDKGYISKALKQKLNLKKIHFLTPIKRNMKHVLWTPFEKYLLQHRSLIETVNDQLKNLCQIEHTRHWSLSGFLVNLTAGLVAYCLS